MTAGLITAGVWLIGADRVEDDSTRVYKEEVWTEQGYRATYERSGA